MKALSDTVWRFELRQGVKFHNGEAFDADDVVYTLNWISNPKNGVKVQRNVNWIKEARKVGPFTVDVEMKRPFPQAFEFYQGRSQSIPTNMAKLDLTVCIKHLLVPVP